MNWNALTPTHQVFQEANEELLRRICGVYRPTLWDDITAKAHELDVCVCWQDGVIGSRLVRTFHVDDTCVSAFEWPNYSKTYQICHPSKARKGFAHYNAQKRLLAFLKKQGGV